mmetsp:Transcript_7597/g.14946  ORF Transcript_7597/g.14946 Transcript_7597/m.14946 type:complete len:327 (+) Transcript_7597:1340-2320(+)
MGTSSSSSKPSAEAGRDCSCAAELDWPVLSSVSSGFSRRTLRRALMLCMHFVHKQFWRDGSLCPLASSGSSNEMGMCDTPPRVMLLSNCAEISATSTWAVMEGAILAVARCSRPEIWSRLDVPFLPRMAMISSILLATFSSLSTICSLGLTSTATFSSFTRCTLTSFFLTSLKPSSSLSSASAALPVFIHLLMPTAPVGASSSEEEEEESDPQSLSSSSSDSSSLPLALASAFFLGFFSFSSSLSLPLSSLSLEASLSLSFSSSSSSSAPFSMKAAISASYCALFFLMFCLMALRLLALVLLIFLTLSLSWCVASISFSSCTTTLM